MREGRRGKSVGDDDRIFSKPSGHDTPLKWDSDLKAGGLTRRPKFDKFSRKWLRHRGMGFLSPHDRVSTYTAIKPRLVDYTLCRGLC